MYSIDISSYQGKNDFAKAKGELCHVIVKATQGNSWNDNTFESNYQGCKANNIPVGAYHYADCNGTPEEQANHFCDRLEGKQWDIKPVLDLEQNVGMDKSEFVRRFAKVIIDRLGMPIVLYSGAYFARDNFDADVKTNYPLWYASYPKEYNSEWFGFTTIAGHQVGGDDSGCTIDGIGSNLDYSYFYEPMMLRCTSQPVVANNATIQQTIGGKIAELQRILGVIVDNVWGSVTDAALQNAHFNANAGNDYHNETLTKWIQLRLGLTADGIYGHETASEVSKWQASHGLTIDGVAGYNTIKSLTLA